MTLIIVFWCDFSLCLTTDMSHKDNKKRKSLTQNSKDIEFLIDLHFSEGLSSLSIGGTALSESIAHRKDW